MDYMDVAPAGPEDVLNQIAQNQCRGSISLTPWQVRALLRIKNERYTVISVPTGSGKSMVFSLLSFWLRKCVMVVTPLLSLMADQEDKLANNFNDLKAAHLGPDVDSNVVREQVEKGEIRIVFVTPESYMTNLVVWSVEKPFFNQYFGAIVIDEAHDLVLVDSNFRPDFLRLCKTQFRQSKLVFLSGSLTMRVERAMIDSVFSHLPNIKEAFENKISESQDRENLYLAICGRKSKTDFQPLGWITTVS
jgi:ATP-dependent DNA helicase RecQ